MSGLLLDAWPAGLQTLRRYLPWRAGVRPNGRCAKIPLAQRGRSLYPHNPLDPAVWQDWARVQRLVHTGAADGVGIVLTADLPWVALDLDDCVDAAGVVDSRALSVLERFPQAYAELSPSGRGLHLLLRARLPRTLRLPGVEFITHGFLTVTGRAIQVPAQLLDASHELERWGQAQAVRPQVLSHSSPREMTDQTLLERAMRARNGRLFQQLWAGELAGYPSLSEGDLALALLLLYWVGDADDGRADRLFRQSGRYRERWDQPAHDPYGQRTWILARRIRAGRTH
ncbi:hypothetical protein E7T06_05225 [Deinococcus sp. Arct2-2]|uniref:phage NrS-1 polymerase family protein n=1 Tax=Deinococcus sp. Arct2-2 TaxID=2568653 RepID=UPI0010A3CF79|nr:hypothetical protein [Deinococcus sp. Arct2-2]THF70958.1 hypothetical protein E7T06_05225 [Deinococcus sp. Arct2-2]